MSAPLVRDQVVAPTAGSYRIDPVRSRIAFTTRHLFGLGAVHGTFELQDGVIRIAEPLEDSSALARDFHGRSRQAASEHRKGAPELGGCGLSRVTTAQEPEHLSGEEA